MIDIGLLLAQRARRVRCFLGTPAGSAPTPSVGFSKTLAKVVTHGSAVLLFGTMFIGAVVSDKNLEAINPFYRLIFMGALCLFLLELGMDAAKRLEDFWRVGVVLTAFGILMPLFGATVGLAIAHYWLGFGPGGMTLVAVLAGSASYIAVPPAIPGGTGSDSIHLPYSLARHHVSVQRGVWHSALFHGGAMARRIKSVNKQ